VKVQKFGVWFRVALLAALFGVSALDASAQATMPDPQDTLDAAELLLIGVSVLTASAVTFFLGIRVIKWLKK